MDIKSLSLIAIALSLDAFGVAVSIGISKGIHRKNKIFFAISFGFFQFLFSIIGAYAGFLFNTYVAAVPKVIGGIAIAIVGILMLKEGLEDKEENFLLKTRMYFVLGISVSIDALVIGFTALDNIKNFASILNQTIFIGLTTLVISSIGFIISKFLRKINVITKYADFIGGIILIIFGLKMIFF